MTTATRRIASEARPALDRRRHYAGTSCPVLVVQQDRFDATDSITICPLTTDPTEIPLLRIRLDPGSSSGLSQPSSIMVDKLTTMPRSELGEYIADVTDAQMLAVSRALVVFLGIA